MLIQHKLSMIRFSVSSSVSTISNQPVVGIPPTKLTISKFVPIISETIKGTIDSPVDTIDAPRTVSTRITIALVHVYFAHRSRRPGSTNALITIDTILASPPELARIALAFVDLRLAQFPRESRKAVATETVLAIDAGPAMARVRLAVVDVCLAGGSRESRRTVARVLGDGVLADSAVLARRRGTVVDVDLAMGTSETVRAGAFERVDEVGAHASV